MGIACFVRWHGTVPDSTAAPRLLSAAFFNCCSYIAGQQPKRQKVVTSAPDLPRAQLLMTQYLEGSLAAAPWDAMGVSKAPVIGGMSHIFGSSANILLNGPKASGLCSRTCVRLLVSQIAVCVSYVCQQASLSVNVLVHCHPIFACLTLQDESWTCASCMMQCSRAEAMRLRLQTKSLDGLLQSWQLT